MSWSGRPPIFTASARPLRLSTPTMFQIVSEDVTYTIMNYTWRNLLYKLWFISDPRSPRSRIAVPLDPHIHQISTNIYRMEAGKCLNGYK